MSRVLQKTGTPDELTAWGTALRAQGLTGEVTLVEVRPGLVRARVVLPGTVAVRPEPGLSRPAPRPRRTGRVKLAVGTAVVVLVLLAVGWVVYEVWVYRYVILGLLVVAAVLAGWYGLGRAGACPGLHCPGCRCGGR